jgi:hypothetical protein
MGILDRFRSAGKAADDVNNKAGTPEQDALRLIDQGHAHEKDGRIDEAMQCYLDALRRAPKLARAIADKSILVSQLRNNDNFPVSEY